MGSWRPTSVEVSWGALPRRRKAPASLELEEMSEQPTPPDGAELKLDPAILAAAYEVIAQRRLGYDQMAWQTPALSFTAQAFLFSIALGADTSPEARLLASLLALAVALLSIQLLAKHHHMELIDSVILENIEKKLGLTEALERAPHSPAIRRRAGLRLQNGNPIEGDCLTKPDSPKLWTAGLGLFAVGALVVAAVAIVDLLG